MTEPLD